MSIERSLTVGDLHEAYSTGALSPIDVIEATLARLAAAPPKVVVGVLADRARRGAAESASRWRVGAALGPLDGVPFAVKDLFDVEGEVAEYGSFVHDAEPAATDAEAVARLHRAGAIAVARTWTHEHAWGMTGHHPVLGGPGNPWAPDRITGGSSAGSAAVVALGLVPLAIGSDTACSIRLPAAWCGTFGWKPSHGWSPLTGVLELSRRLDHLGVLARSLADLSAAHDVLADQPLAISTARSFTVASALVTAPIADARIAALLRSVHAGLGVPPVVLPDAEAVIASFVALQAEDAMRVHRDERRWWPARRAEYGADVAGRLELAEQVTGADVAAAVAERGRLAAEVASLFDEHGLDVVVSPVAGCLPPFVTTPDNAPLAEPSPLRPHVLVHCALQPLLGLPSLAFPVGVVDGLPVGVQVWGRVGADATVLAAGRTIAAKLGLPHRLATA